MGNVYLDSCKSHKLRVAIMSDDPKSGYEKSNVEKNRKKEKELNKKK